LDPWPALANGNPIEAKTFPSSVHVQSHVSFSPPLDSENVAPLNRPFGVYRHSPYSFGCLLAHFFLRSVRACLCCVFSFESRNSLVPSGRLTASSGYFLFSVGHDVQVWNSAGLALWGTSSICACFFLPSQMIRERFCFSYRFSSSALFLTGLNGAPQNRITRGRGGSSPA